jgi:hypothetical protein
MFPIYNLNPFKSASSTPFWTLNPLPHQINQIKRVSEFIKEYYRTDLSVSLNQDPTLESPSKTWLNLLVDISEDRDFTRDENFLHCFLFALAADPNLNFKQKCNSFKIVLQNLDQDLSDKFYNTLPSLPLIIRSHLLLYSSFEARNTILESINSPHLALTFIQAIFNNIWSLEEKGCCLDKLHVYFSHMNTDSKQRLFRYLKTYSSKEFLLWVKRTSPKLYFSIKQTPPLPSTQLLGSLYNFPVPADQLELIKTSFPLIKQYYEIELATSIVPHESSEPCKTWLQYFTDIERNNPISNNANFLCSFLFSVAAHPFVSKAKKLEVSINALASLNEKQGNEFLEHLALLPHLMSSHLLLYSSTENEFIILNQIKDGESLLRFINTLFENIWTFEQQKEALEKLYDYLKGLPSEKKEELSNYIKREASQEVLQWIKLALPELYTDLTVPAHIPLEHISNKA